MKKIVLFNLIAIVLFAAVSYSEDLTRLKDTNYIHISPINRNGKIEILVFYENTDKGLDVLWSDKLLDYKCFLYDSGDTQIVRKTGKLSSFDQRIYIKIPSWDRDASEEGKVKCEFDIGWPHLKAEGSVNLK